MRIAPFTVDITPPIGFPLAYSANDKADSPVFVRGLVIEDSGERVVLAAADVIGLYGLAYPQWRRAIAAAAKTPERNVLIHAVHQHDSLFPITREVANLLGTYPDSVPGELELGRHCPRASPIAFRPRLRRAKKAPGRTWRRSQRPNGD